VSVATAVTPLRVATSWALDPLALVAIILTGVAYVRAVTCHDALRAAWSRSRTVAFLSGLGVLLVATQSGFATYEVVFTLHVLQHVMIGMIAPLLLIVGAPITLALRITSPDHRRFLHRVLRHPITRAATNPLVGWSLFTGSIALVYLTPVYEASVDSPAVHVWLHGHFLVAGLLFCWPLVGADAAMFRVAYPLRLIMVLLALPFHAFVAVALLGGPDGLAVAAPARLQALGIDPVADVRTGAGLLWVLGDLLAVVLAGAIAVSWMRTTERRASLAERHEASAPPGAAA
jgi:putative membrane protein